MLSHELALVYCAGVGKYQVRWSSADDGSGASAIRGLDARLHSHLGARPRKSLGGLLNIMSTCVPFIARNECSLGILDVFI